MSDSANDVYTVLEITSTSGNINDTYTVLEVIATSGNIIEIVNTEKILASDISAAGNVHINQIDGGSP